MSIPAAIVTLPTTPVPPIAVDVMALGHWVPDLRNPGPVRLPGRGDEVSTTAPASRASGYQGSGSFPGHLPGPDPVWHPYLPLRCYGGVGVHCLRRARGRHGLEPNTRGWTRELTASSCPKLSPASHAAITVSAYAEPGRLCRAKQLSGQRDLQPLEGWRRGTWSRQRKKRSLS